MPPAPQTSMTLITAITETGAEPARLDRYRNEQAAELLGIKVNKANTSGLLTLRRLGACAPDLESDVVFLPQNRALNVVKACQAWATSDDADIDEEVESAMTLIFEYLAPILQNVPGSHWDFIWDVLENNFEVSILTISLACFDRKIGRIRPLQMMRLLSHLHGVYVW